MKTWRETQAQGNESIVLQNSETTEVEEGTEEEGEEEGEVDKSHDVQGGSEKEAS